MTIKAGLVTSFYSHDIILVLFYYYFIIYIILVLF